MSIFRSRGSFLLLNDYLTRKTLLLRIRDEEDERAWAEFVEIYTPLIFNFCRRRGLAEQDSADVVQETMRAVARAIKNFEYSPERGTFRSWLYTVARSKLNNYFRDRARQPVNTETEELDQRAAAEEHDWDLEYRRQIFKWASDSVRGEFQEQTWTAFWRTAVEEHPANAVASELGMKIGSIYTARSRIISRIREKIASVSGEADFPETLISTG